MTKKKYGLSGQGQTQPKISPDDISVINFEGVKVRIVKSKGEPWFIVKDVCAALEIADHLVPLRRLGAQEKGEYSIPTLGGIQRMIAVSESGFYKLIARSRKASTEGSAAFRFSEWVAKAPPAEITDLDKVLSVEGAERIRVMREIIQERGKQK